MIRQISVFVENQPGSMMNVTNVLTEAHVNIRAISTFDTPEFGIMRLVVDDLLEDEIQLIREKILG